MTSPMIRLHITPLRPDLLRVVLGSELSQLAKNVSYHQIQSNPENNFGYVEIPTMEAEKIKKKLNGAILKGQKVKIEEARPLKRRRNETEDEATDVANTSAPSLPKKSRKDRDTLSGHELPEDRKVKRGWTEPKGVKSKEKRKDKKDKASKTQAPSKYTDKEELLFRAKVPPNKSTKDTKGKNKKGEKSDDSEVVHEFKKTTAVPSFLRHNVDGSQQKAAEYRDGEGWVDAEGNVVEQESTRVSRKRKAAKLGLEIDVTKAEASNMKRSQQTPLSPPSSVPATTSTSASSSSRVTDEAEEETSSSGSSSSSENSESDVETENEQQTETDIMVDSQPEATSTSTAPPAVHPLEALFKKPKLPTITTTGPDNETLSMPTTASTGSGKSKPTLELTTSFSFFGNQDESEDEAEGTTSKTHLQATTTTPQQQKPPVRQAAQRVQTPHDNDISHNLPPLPLTPFSTADFRIRRIRSAAPTPDTGDIRKSTGYGSLILGEDDPNDILSDGEDQQDNNHLNNNLSVTDKQNQTQLPQSEFEKKFWQQRGENNRAWKARRRAVLKEKRQRENRARRPRTF